MTDEVVKVVKAKKEPKEPRFRKGLTAEQWATKLASMTVEKIPDGYMIMSEIVKAARNADIKVSRICTAMGGDRAMNEPWDPIFQVVYVGGRKYGSPDILTKGFALLKDETFHKVERKGRPKKEKIEGEVGGKKVSLKAADFKPADVWKGK